jgi:anti-sigma B factor antagonist
VDANINVRRAGGVAVAVLHGEYDLGNADALHAELLEVLRSRPTGIVLDVAGVEFCDLACLRSMANVGRRAAALGVWVRIAGPMPMLRRVLKITGLGATLPAYRDVELALRGPRSGVSLPAGRTVADPLPADHRSARTPDPVHAAAGPAEV